MTTSQESESRERFFSGDLNTRQPGDIFNIPEHFYLYMLLNILLCFIYCKLWDTSLPRIYYMCWSSVILYLNVTILYIIYLYYKPSDLYCSCIYYIIIYIVYNRIHNISCNTLFLTHLQHPPLSTLSVITYYNISRHICYSRIYKDIEQ